MAYNLDFSGWQDARRAMADSIINQANIRANLIAQRADVISKTLSGVAKNALWSHGKADERAAENAIGSAMANRAAAEAQGLTGLAVDPMQALSASGGLTNDATKNYKRAQLVNGLLRYV